jgi:hypothetical protein
VNPRDFFSVPFFNAFHSAKPCSAASLPHVFRYLHGTEMRGVRAFLRQSFVMEFAEVSGIAAGIELIFPAKFKTRFPQGVVAKLRAGMAFLIGRSVVS